MSAVKVPDKLPYTKGEKTAEAVCGGICAAIVAAELVLMILGKITSGAVIILLVSLIIYGVFSVCSVYPQHTNIFNKPENCSEAKFRKARRILCWARLIFVAALFALTLI